jgi:hypothetical protein
LLSVMPVWLTTRTGPASEPSRLRSKERIVTSSSVSTPEAPANWA